MRFHEDKLARQIYARSINGEKQLTQITDLGQLAEIKAKAAVMKRNIEEYLQMAAKEELTNTVEF